MNYTVHSIMYFYFGLTQCGPTYRKAAKRFSLLVTTMQLSQMMVGIVVTVASVGYHARGDVCYVSLPNSALGLLMYVSYFVLFAILFYNNYVVKASRPDCVTTSAKDVILTAAVSAGELTAAAKEASAKRVQG